MAVHEPPSPPPTGGGWGPFPERRRTGGGELRLTHADRDSAVETLREAYAAGQLDESEFEERLGLAINAKFPSELEPLFADLVRSGSRAAGKTTAGKTPVVDDGPVSAADRLMAGVGHVSGYLSFVGPLVMLLASKDASPFVRRHITEALNFQLTVTVATLTGMALIWLFLPILVVVVATVGWMVLPAVAGLSVLVGGDMKYPLTWRPVRDQ
ncbi:DUF1707 and DUF4870 domain-containing protein [Streptomonospora litoralis]|uniref:DUF1707 domain-containing protein n=1 Tax=Streptomonospora litoralis TaxID=2498135 RepID=A0A4P6PW90_9ACTN|nr:DUF1707 and DUF4870 domain-containing protein [Streptomonospora litoralis]QBI51890.1 hypothetical protein EKD16_00335 [Streptomonospora litoralis]